MEKVNDMLAKAMKLIEDRLKQWGIFENDNGDENKRAINKADYLKEQIVKNNTGVERKEGELIDDYLKRAVLERYKDEQPSYVKGIIESFHHRFEEIDKQYNVQKIDRGKEWRELMENELNEKLKGYRAVEISGYRTEEDNNKLRAQGRPAATNSQHLDGNAFDVQYLKTEVDPNNIFAKPKTRALTNEEITEGFKKKDPEIMKLLDQMEAFARENHLVWGGWFKDENLRNQEWDHFQRYGYENYPADWSYKKVGKEPEIKQQETKQEVYKIPAQPIDKSKDKIKIPSIPISKDKEKVEIPTNQIRETIKRQHDEDKPQIKGQKGLSENSEDIIKQAFDSLNRTLLSMNDKKVEVKIKFQDAPLGLVDLFQNAIVEVG
jgi:uncharacterized protein YcbK (DUF882 family)